MSNFFQVNIGNIEHHDYVLYDHKLISKNLKCSKMKGHADGFSFLFLSKPDLIIDHRVISNISKLCNAMMLLNHLLLKPI